MYSLHIESEINAQQPGIQLDMNLGQDSDEESSTDNILKQLIQQPVNNLFDSVVSDIYQDQQEQPNKQLSTMIDSLLLDIDSNEKILNSFTQANEDEDEIIDTLDEFEFREYQIDLYEKGIGKNSIIYLETGLGKTLVIIMLMWERIKKYPKKKVVFLANTIQLVEQQAAQIRKKMPRVAELLEDDDNMVEKAKQLGRDIKIIHGSKCTDVWNSLIWQLMLEENQIFVMTTQIFLNILRKGYKKIEEFCFIAMDECHSAIQDHPYNYILKEFYLPTKNQHKQSLILDQLPQIVGATASPVMNSRSVTDEQILKELLQLAANMDSYYLYTDVDSIKKHLHEAKVIPVQYQTLFNDPDIQRIIDLRSGYEQCVKSESRVFDVMRKNNYLPEFFQLQDKMEEFKKSYAGNLSMKIIITQIQKQILVNGFQMYLELGQYVFILILEFVITKMKDYLSLHRQKSEEVKMNELIRYLDLLLSTVSKKYGNVYSSCTPKVKALVDVLVSAYSKDLNSMMLIFVKQRITACYLNKIIEAVLCQQQLNLKSDFIIGHCSTLNRKGSKQLLINVIDSEQNDEEELIKTLYSELQRDQSKFSIQELKEQVTKLYIFKYTINFAQQKEILSNFRSGQTKILISTSVAEEGIDIPMCNYVLGFNPISSSKAYVQMKGRARKENSKFIIFMADKIVSQAKVQSHQKVQHNTKKIIEELVLPQRQPILSKAIAKLQIQSLEKQYYDSFTIAESGANINTNWSCNLIHQFCQSVQLEGGEKGVPKYAIYQLQSEKKKSNGEFLAFLLLPMQLKQFIFYGEKAETAQQAKASAALCAAKQLYSSGYLDSNLRPNINSDIGSHIGADQDDSQIMMTKEQLQIANQFSTKIIANTSLLGWKLNSQQRYYYSLHKTFFTSKEKPKEYYQLECKYEKSQIMLLLTNQLYDQLYQCEKQLNLCGLQLIELKKISEITYWNYYEQYINTIIEEENLVTVSNNLYSVIEKDYQIKFADKESANYLLVLKSEKNKLKLRQIIAQLELGLKIYKSKEKILAAFETVREKKQLDIQLQPNRILGEIKDHCKNLTALRYGWQKIPQERVNYQIIYKQYKEIIPPPLKDNLDYLLMKSLDLKVHNPNELLLGDGYYKLLISLQLYANSFLNDCRITANKIKTYTRSTYVRNCLLESHMFMYLHKYEEEGDLMKTYVGMQKYQDYFAEMVSSATSNSQQKGKFIHSNAALYKTHLSNQEFYQFLQKSLSLIQAEDNNFTNGFRWIEILNLTNQIKYPLTQVTDLLQLAPLTGFSNQIIDNLKLIYNQLEESIRYSFTNFELLFQAMTDISFKHALNNKVQQNYYKPFSYKEELAGVITEIQLSLFQNQFDQMNKMECSNYENSNLSILGRSIWNFLTIKYVTKKLSDPIAIRVLGKILTNTPFLAYLSLKLKIYQFLNCGGQQQLVELAQQTESLKDQSIAFHITNQATTYITILLENSFYALVAAIFFDSKCNIRNLEQWQEYIFEKMNCQILFTKDYIARQPKYKFYTWYQQHFGNPLDFNLIKIPHQDYKKLSQGQYLFVPYDMKKAQIVNIKRDKFYDITQLHINAKSKRQAWEKLNDIVEY